MNMKTAYKVYLFCCVLFLTGLFLLVPIYAVEDMWTAASRIIKDIYTHIASVSTVLAGLMTAVAVIGAKMSNTQQKSDQAWDWLKRIWLAGPSSTASARLSPMLSRCFRGLPHWSREISHSSNGRGDRLCLSYSFGAFLNGYTG